LRPGGRTDVNSFASKVADPDFKFVLFYGFKPYQEEM